MRRVLRVAVVVGLAGGGGSGFVAAGATNPLLVNGANGGSAEVDGQVTISWTVGAGCAIDAVARFVG